MIAFNLIKDLRPYQAHVLAYPEIGNTEVIRDEFKTDSGLVFYSKKRTAFAPVPFTIEFKGTKEEIRKNRNKVSNILEYATITFDNEVFYRGRFLEESVETRYFFQNVTFKGQAIAMLNTQVNEIPIGETVRIYNNGNLPTPCRLRFEGETPYKVIIKGFDDDISIHGVDENTVIDSEKGLYKTDGIDQFELTSFPYITDYVDILVEGKEGFKCFLEFEGRVLC